MRFSEINPNKHLAETALAANNPKADLEAKRKALQDLERQPGVDLAAIRQRKLELEKEARAKGLATDVAEEKVRLDPACWHNKKIGNPKTKVKGGVRVNNCVPKESVEEAYGPWGKKTPQDIEKIRKHLEREKKNTTPGQLRKSETPTKKKQYGRDQAISHFVSLEDFNPEYDDEAGVVDNNLETLRRAVDGIDELIQPGDNLPEWCQEKIANAEQMLVGVWDYMKSEQDRGATAELAEEFDMIERIIECIAAQNGVDSDVVWTDLESLTEDELYAFAVTSQLNEDWSKVNKKDKTDGMSQKAVNAYRRENPGSKLKTAVTTKPSKLKKGSKASKRRKSYCSRSKGQMNMHNISCAKTPDKAICKARRRWNC